MIKEKQSTKIDELNCDREHFCGMKMAANDDGFQQSDDESADKNDIYPRMGEKMVILGIMIKKYLVI